MNENPPMDPRLHNELRDAVISMEDWLNAAERSDPEQLIRGLHWQLERVAEGDY